MLVSVLCLCYNHARFVEEAVVSVMAQTYTQHELIVVDDGSTDNSVEVIERLQQKYPSIRFVNNVKNIGMCRSFNKALALAQGDFVIDLAADDVLMPERLAEQVKAFSRLNPMYGVVYSDAYLISESGEKLSTFYQRNELGTRMVEVPQGDVFKELIQRYKICSPTIMMRKSMLDELGGYDATLSYEDYDFFVRSSRNYWYHYIDKPLTCRRIVAGSDSSSWYKRGHNPHLISTLEVCKKALWLCRCEEEKRSLLHSLRYHMRQSYYTENYFLVGEYLQLIGHAGGVSWSDGLFRFLANRKISVYRMYQWYRKWSYQK
jgi:glycosyltransferase involved in cell wall biosynthesis